MMRRVLITAGASGTGLAMAQAFEAEGYAAGTALKRLSDAQAVADDAVFLASSRARMITGQALAVDGFIYNVDP